MRSALVGYTGFIGANLMRAGSFDLLINRANLESLRGAHLDRLVCAGLPAAKWIANQQPQEDADNIRRLEAVLSTVQVETFILISTIDVYPRTADADEAFDCSTQANHPYGANRLQFEFFVRKHFPRAHIVRLPALFGHGLKKNTLYDLINDNRLERINIESRFQWYPLVRLTSDLQTIELQNLPLVNLFTEPFETQVILDQLFPRKPVGQLPDPPVQYDLHTRYGTLFGGNSHYVMSKGAVLATMREFLRAEQVLQ